MQSVHWEPTAPEAAASALDDELALMADWLGLRVVG